ncbi:MAG TPA: RDD family protein [Pseudomonas xinjiangensis]|uniref:RDD family protein n=2 Tax=root TaxID=1 RepID=A0A7V1BMI1_9GAMM|nr:RDD family protein [Halopseudomonas xinjiangensis]HEC49190.1 RDD family protein [Halopseudomonas xinjiangensis]
MAVKQLKPVGDFPTPGLAGRLASAFYDFLLCLGLVMVITLLYQQGVLRQLYGSDTLRAMSEAGTLDHDPVLSIVVLLSLFAFFGTFWTLKGQTLGMQVWRLRVEQAEGHSITWRQAVIRFLVAFPAWLLGGLGILWALWDRQSRTWQDIASGTRLVKLPKTKG